MLLWQQHKGGTQLSDVWKRDSRLGSRVQMPPGPGRVAGVWKLWSGVVGDLSIWARREMAATLDLPVS